MYKLSWEMVDAVRSISASGQRSVRDSQSVLPRASLTSNQRSDINIPGERSFCTGDGQIDAAPHARWRIREPR